MNDYQVAIKFFTTKCRNIDSVYDVLLRGTAIHEDLLKDNWSDIDFSIILSQSTPDTYRQIRQIVQDIRARFNFKISITIVELSDFLRHHHNHGIKPNFYSQQLDQALSLFEKDTLTLRNYFHDVDVHDCFYNIVYLVHDIRSKYLHNDHQHILKRTKYVILNAMTLMTQQVINEIDGAIFCKLFGDTYLQFVTRLQSIKQDWDKLAQNPCELDQLTTEAVIVTDFIYRATCLHMDKIRQKKKIVVFTDCNDIAYSEIHHTLTNELERLGIYQYEIAPLICVQNFSVINAAFCIRLMADLCKSETIFLVIVNGINTNPIRIFGETNNGLIFIGNNSGYFSWLLKDFGVKCLYQSSVTRAINNRSFGGRNVQAPLAALIAANKPYDTLGEKSEPSTLNMMEIPSGAIVHIDNFGLIKMNRRVTDEIASSKRIDVYVNNEYKITATFAKKMKTLETGSWVIFPGSSLDPPLLEIAKVRSPHTANELGAKMGDIIELRPHED